jgi:hypothetical protein
MLALVWCCYRTDYQPERSKIPMTPAYKAQLEAVRELIANYKPNSKDDLLTFQQTVGALAKTARDVELLLRRQLVEAFSTQAKPGHSGTENINVGWGYILKVVHAIDYKLDTADDSAKVTEALNKIEKSMEGGNIIADRLVKWKPELSVSEYKKLGPAQKALIDGVITVKDSTPSVELVPGSA